MKAKQKEKEEQTKNEQWEEIQKESFQKERNMIRNGKEKKKIPREIKICPTQQKTSWKEFWTTKMWNLKIKKKEHLTMQVSCYKLFLGCSYCLKKDGLIIFISGNARIWDWLRKENWEIELLWKRKRTKLWWHNPNQIWLANRGMET
jgi:hypothetical protein